MFSCYLSPNPHHPESGKIDDRSAHTSTTNVNWWLKDPDWRIHSVKRLSDGEVFTIGDKTNHGIITGFLNAWAGMEVHFEKDGYLLSGIKKLNPLFTTHDGKQIFEGDNYFLINKSFLITETRATVFCGGSNDVAVRISTKEAAEEYTIWNKPLLGLHEICNVFQKNRLDHDSKDGKRKKIEEDLIELAKQKL